MKTLLYLWLSTAVLYGVFANLCVETNTKSCGDCMQVAGCGWCDEAKYADNPNLIISRCDLPENLIARNCSKHRIVNPPSSVKATVNAAHSGVGSSDVGTATQLKPQKFEGELRPGTPVDITLSYKQAEDYPVDLYYLLDLSNSMEDDLESLRKLGKELGESMASITRDFRLGFGSFVDKTVMPFISTVPNVKKNPCWPKLVCQPTYSFSNDLPLTDSIDDFVTSVNDVSHSSNIDAPEGGFDAMMQAIVCQNYIKWRKDATHLLVYVTDAVFHYAGDGKLGGIVTPNNGHCYLDGRGRYTKANEMDYPSVGHLVQKITDYNIQPIFAVTEKVINTYKKLQQLIPKSAVGELSANSSNIIELIENAYNDLKGQVLLEVATPPGIEVIKKVAHCGDGDREGLSCDGVKIGDVVNFTLSVSTTECFPGTKKLDVSIFGYNEKVEVTMQSLCECQCNTTDAPSANCSGHGVFDCGGCVCDTGYLGLECSCDKKDSTAESYIVNCTNTDGEVCGNRGECLCGKCICRQMPNRKIDGKYCECDNTTCDIINGEYCNGHGLCNCGNCICEKEWRGDGCECTKDTTGCMDPNDEEAVACHGSGLCECGNCKCNITKSGFEYLGTYCEISPQQLCNIHKECVQCIVYGNRKEFEKNDTLCVDCQQYSVNILEDEETSKLRESCRAVDSTNDCTFTFWFERRSDTVYIDTNPDKQVCPMYANPMYIIIGIIAAIVGIGLAILLIWKLLTSIKDAREYKQWRKEVQTAKWETGGNPLFKSATSTFQNPTYKAGKPTSQL